MFYLIIAVVVVIVGLYLAPSETKGGLKWFGRGLRGVAQDAKAIRTQSLERTVLDPNRVESVISMLDTSVIDTTKYHAEATRRNLQAETSYKAKVAEIAAILAETAK